MPARGQHDAFVGEQVGAEAVDAFFSKVFGEGDAAGVRRVPGKQICMSFKETVQQGQVVLDDRQVALDDRLAVLQGDQ